MPNFKSFLLKMTKFCSRQARNAIKMKVKWGKNNSKFVLGSYGSIAMHSIIFQHMHLKMFRLQMTKLYSRQAENAVKISVKRK